MGANVIKFESKIRHTKLSKDYSMGSAQATPRKFKKIEQYKNNGKISHYWMHQAAGAK